MLNLTSARFSFGLEQALTKLSDCENVELIVLLSAIDASVFGAFPTRVKVQLVNNTTVSEGSHDLY